MLPCTVAQFHTAECIAVQTARKCTLAWNELIHLGGLSWLAAGSMCSGRSAGGPSVPPPSSPDSATEFRHQVFELSRIASSDFGTACSYMTWNTALSLLPLGRLRHVHTCRRTHLAKRGVWGRGRQADRQANEMDLAPRKRSSPPGCSCVTSSCSCRSSAETSTITAPAGPASRHPSWLTCRGTDCFRSLLPCDVVSARFVKSHQMPFHRLQHAFSMACIQ